MHSDQNLPPVPRALSDEELQEVLDRAKAENAGILVQMQILEAQAQLRETDKSEYAAWLAGQQEQPLAPAPEVFVEPMSLAFEDQHEAEQEATAFDEIFAEHLPAPLETVELISEDNAASVQMTTEALESTEAPASAVVAEPAFVTESSELSKSAVAPQMESVQKSHAEPKSASQFWVWLTISGSLFPFGVALWLQSLGLTFVQGVVAILLGIFVSAGVIAVGAIAGKRSSLSTLLLSRAAFGVFGNLAPASLLVISRLFWALALVVLGYLLIGRNFGTEIGISAKAGPISVGPVLILAALVLGSVAVSAMRSKYLIWAQRSSGVIGVITAIALASFRFSVDGIHITEATEGSWLRTLGAAVLIFALFGLAWSSASADYASHLKHAVRGWKVAGWSFLALGIVPSCLAILGLVLFANDNSRDFSQSFIELAAGSASPLSWLVLASLVISLTTITAMSLKSSAMSFESLGLKTRERVATPLVAIVAAVFAVFGMNYLGAAGIWLNLHGYALVVAVPVAAWSGVFVSDVLIRRIAYHEVSLNRGYGFYKRVNWVNLGGWGFSVFVGLGLLKSNLVEFQWLGYLADFASNSEFWAQSNLGVVIAFALALIFPVAFGIPRIKRQEAEVLLIESRRQDLVNVLGDLD